MEKKNNCFWTRKGRKQSKKDSWTEYVPREAIDLDQIIDIKLKIVFVTLKNGKVQRAINEKQGKNVKIAK